MAVQRVRRDGPPAADGKDGLDQTDAVGDSERAARRHAALFGFDDGVTLGPVERSEIVALGSNHGEIDDPGLSVDNKPVILKLDSRKNVTEASAQQAMAESGAVIMEADQSLQCSVPAS